MAKPAHLIFDLDGTISDPFDGIYRSFNFALRTHGLNEVAESAVAALIGPPLDEGFRTLLPGASEAQIVDLVSSYRERYAQVGFSENSLYPGITEAFAGLAESGVRLGVCTSKRVDFAEQILTLFEVRHYFDFVDGGDVGIKKSQQLQGLLKSGDITRLSIMIGDRGVDILSAHANGLSAVGVLWGYGSEAELNAAGAEVTIGTVDELSSLFTGDYLVQSGFTAHLISDE